MDDKKLYGGMPGVVAPWKINNVSFFNVYKIILLSLPDPL